MKKSNAKKWVAGCIGTFFFLCIAMVILTIVVDPYFHYHKPLKNMKYRLYEERYINDGISRNFVYDAIITGNSLTENFKTSELDELFGVNSIKLPYSGAGYKEIWGSLSRALQRNPDTKMVVVVLDYDDLSKDKDYMRYDDYPEYLYDDSLLNDMAYLLNKDVFYRGTMYNILMTITGTPSTTFDEYASWEHETGAQKVMKAVGTIWEPELIRLDEYTSEDEKRVHDNVVYNITSLTEQYPDTQFYLCFAPNSIAQWCQWYNFGEIGYRISAEKTAVEELLQYDNIHLSCFYDKHEWICNLDNYSDTVHYTPQINSEILAYMKSGEYELTKENYEEHIAKAFEFYGNYDYLSLKTE
ncbi:MAG: hypothetical protein ACI39N_07580 [Lachnospiraceae bacterium]